MREARPRRGPWILATVTWLLLAGCASDEPPRHDWLLGSRLPSTDTLVADALPTQARTAATTAPAIDAAVNAATAAESGAASAGAPGTSQAPSPAAAAPASPALSFWPRLQSSQAIAPLPEPLWSVAWSEYAARPDFVSRALQRAAPYLQHVGEVLDQQGLPPEAHLAQLQPRAIA